MNIIASLLVSILFLATSVAWAEADRSLDLRYCLELQSNSEIAKCAGEISPGSKGKPYTREEVDRILSGTQARVPMSSNDVSGSSAVESEDSNNELIPENNESGGD